MSSETSKTSHEISAQDEFVTIATFPEPMEASMARSALEAAGIHVFLQGEAANTMIPVAFASCLQVRSEDEAAARSLLDAMNNAPETLESVTAAEIADEQIESAVRR
jgi:hypothetical protein